MGVAQSASPDAASGPARPACPAQEDAPKVKTRKVFQFAHKMCTALATTYPQTALRLFLQAAQTASNLEEKEIAYEFMTQACILYEDTADSRQQVVAVSLIVATLHAIAVFDEDTYAELAKRATQYSAKLLRKPDQCRMVQKCSHLFWVQREVRAAPWTHTPRAAGPAPHSAAQGGYRDDKRVLECLQRALKIADACMSSSVHVQLFVDILNEYLYFFEHKNPAVRGPARRQPPPPHRRHTHHPADCRQVPDRPPRPHQRALGEHGRRGGQGRRHRTVQEHP